MPVLVTGLQRGGGRVVVDHLQRGGGEVRVYLDAASDAAERYRRMGVKVARGSLADEGRLEVALEQVHTVVHVGGGPLEEPAAVLDELASVTSAAIGAGCRRLVWSSHLGAQEPGGNPYLQACAEGEALLADAPMETVVVRRALTYGPGDPLTLTLAAGVGVPAQARHAPLYADDLALTVLAADAERGGVAPRSLVVTLAGPQVLALAELVEGLSAVCGARSGARPLPPHAWDLLARDQLPPADALGRTGTTPRDGLALLRAAGGREW